MIRNDRDVSIDGHLPLDGIEFSISYHLFLVKNMIIIDNPINFLSLDIRSCRITYNIRNINMALDRN